MTSLTATGQVIAGRYELTRFIAGGAMGEVWESHDERMDRVVAVKVLRPEYARDPIAVERFRTEARLAARLAHPGIALVHDVDAGASPDEPPWMVQEYVPGRPLSDLLATTGALDPFRAAGLIAQAADAVHAAHLAGVVHRDLTPGNLLVCDGDIVKITDFGIARAAGGPALTATGQVLGAAAYLSPEQVAGEPASPGSDIYTLGVVLYECLSGARPFTGANAVEVARAHLHQQPPALPASVPEPLRVTTSETMAKDPADRPGSAADLAARLREVARLRPEPMPNQALGWDWFAPASARVASGPSVTPGETHPLPKTAPPSPPVDAPTPRHPAIRPRAVRPPVATGAAAVRLATRPRTRRSPTGSTRVALPPSAGGKRAQNLWRRHPVSRIGIAGGIVILLVVLAVLWSGTVANAAPGIDMRELGTGTVRVGDVAGKGDR
jgi:eukaryotic-like serine/threonine-protein kinase